MVSFFNPDRDLTPEELAAANSSCETCKFVRRPYYYDYTTFMCDAPQNSETSYEFNPVTGKPYPKHLRAAAARSHTNACGPTAEWRVAQLVVVGNGAAKYIEQFYKEAPPPREPFKPTGVLPTSIAKLRAMKSSSIDLEDI